MRRKLNTAQLRQIVTIRELQRIAAEAEASRAATVLSEQAIRMQQAEASRDAATEHWGDLHAQDILPLDLLALWTHAVQQEERNVKAVADDVKEAAAVRDTQLEKFHMLEQRKRLADDMLDAANRDRVRALDEAALQLAADRHLHGEDTPCI